MTKTDLIASIANRTNVAKKDIEEVLAAFQVEVTELLKKGDKLQLVGFGTYEVKERAARTGLNPLTGEKIEIAACKVPTFKAGKALKDAVNEVE